MSDPTPNEPPPGTPPSSGLSISLAQREVDAVALIKRGVISGYVLALMNAFLAWRIYDIGYGVNEAAGEDRIVIAATTLFMAVLAAALAFRFGRRYSIWIPMFFLAWVAFEVVAKLLGGGPTAGYILIAGLVVFGLISGLRGALALRKARQAIEATKI
jgi:hypothetical protein